MRRYLSGLLPLLGLAFTAAFSSGEPQTSGEVPKGEIRKYTFDKSKIFPGTVRDY